MVTELSNLIVAARLQQALNGLDEITRRCISSTMPGSINADPTFELSGDISQRFAGPNHMDFSVFHALLLY